MENLIFSLNATVPIFLLMILGLLFHKIGWIDDVFAQKMNKFVFVVPLPVLVFSDLATVDFHEVWNMKFVLFCFLATFLSITLVSFMSLGLKERALRGEFIQASYRSLLTHGHYDHTGAVYAVHEETGAPVYMHALDAGTAVAFDSYSFVPPEGTIFYKEGDEVRVGNLTFRVMETPGHTPGGVTLICGDALFTGDTLFAGSCGRTDFEGGSMEVELQSLAKIAALPGDYEVYPGHMDCSTLETERRFNPYLTALQHRGQ